MKTAKNVSEAIKSILAESRFMDEKMKKKASSQIAFLELARNYLETGPTEELILKMKSDVEKKLSKADEAFSLYHSEETDPKKRRATWDSLNKVSDKKVQLKMLNFILEP